MSSSSPSSLKELSSTLCFGGLVKRFSHASSVLKCDMVFSVFLPGGVPKAPVLYFLSGLTCTDQNFITKAGAQRAASKHGIALVCPDTSPRGLDIAEDDPSEWDFGSGAGFYLNATKSPWSDNFHMYDYVTKELPALVNSSFDVDPEKMSIFGHSMGGHGALTIALKNAGAYRSVSAFAPICNPTKCPWGEKAFSGYLGDEDKDAWNQYDATHLISQYTGKDPHILIDQGSADGFYEKKQLLPENFVSACERASIPLTYRLQEGYDHSYYFISTFVDDHIEHHAKYLC